DQVHAYLLAGDADRPDTVPLPSAVAVGLEIDTPVAPAPERQVAVLSLLIVAREAALQGPLVQIRPSPSCGEGQSHCPTSLRSGLELIVALASSALDAHARGDDAGANFEHGLSPPS